MKINKDIQKQFLKEEKKKEKPIDLTINEQITFTLPVPYLKELCPIMEVFIYEAWFGSTKKLLGIG